MTQWKKVLCWAAAGWFSTGAAAQGWTVYSPPEKDFRVVFPQQPSRVDAANGAVAFTASAEGIEFTVYRRDPRREPLDDNAARAMQKRLQAADSDERQARRKGGDDDEPGEPGATEHVFRVGNRMSVHRLFPSRDRYYELMVRTSRDNFGEARSAARDFFGSFQAGSGVLVPGNAVASIAPDVLCKGRSNAFSRTFCEYRTCFQAGYEKHPYCTKLIGW